MSLPGPRFRVDRVTIKKDDYYQIVDAHGELRFAPVLCRHLPYPKCQKLYKRAHDLNMQHDPVYRAQRRQP